MGTIHKVMDALADVIRLNAALEAMATQAIAQQRRIELLTARVAYMEGQRGIAPLSPDATRLPALEEVKRQEERLGEAMKQRRAENNVTAPE